MTSEPKPFLTADSIGKEYKARGGATVQVIAPLDDGYFAVSQKGMRFSLWAVRSDGRIRSDSEQPGDILPPAPPEPERRTLWIYLYTLGGASIYKTKSHANESAKKNILQGNPVPVNLELGADGNWGVVAELTQKQKAADDMYETLNEAHSYLTSIGERYFKITAKIYNAIAKADGRE